MKYKLLKVFNSFRDLFSIGGRFDKIDKMIAGFYNVQDIQYRDVLDILNNDLKIKHNSELYLKTDFPVAYESLDHLFPLGTMQDNTRSLSFYNRCSLLYGNQLSYLDLGCSGGGLVFDFALHGCVSIGLEGSDFSKKKGRANWRTIPNNLFTCDIVQPFGILSKINSDKFKFKVISCWEVLEHIKESDLEQFFVNVLEQLDSDGIFVGSISQVTSDPLHVTIKEYNWWKSVFLKYGLIIVSEDENPFGFSDYARGVGGGVFDTCNYSLNPELGFHFVAKKNI
jgi:2-polyprenyl-3-methyl-5-hydroxy-6-metoxy-1,4-benzoquinol methylase